MNVRSAALALAAAVLLGTACQGPAIEPAAYPGSPRPARSDLSILAVGDVNLGRDLGQRLLAGEVDFPFVNVRAEISGAGIAFANLESPLSDQKGTTEGSSNYVFTGPPEGADALQRAGFDVVSTANNHAWDFGERAMLETLANLRRVGIMAVGTGPSLDEAYRAVVIESGGWRVGFIAVTHVFNAPIDESPAREHVAWADPVIVPVKIRELRGQGVDFVVLSYHGGIEYSPAAADDTREFAHLAIDAGADIVIGHHPHVVQNVEWYKGRPILYSLGNFVFRQFDPGTEWGLAVRITLRDHAAPQIHYLVVETGYQPRFIGDPERQARLDALAERSGGSLYGAGEASG
jgi:poly-gamma-glutamate synthesis protein (capsule biosynthesis protein)